MSESSYPERTAAVQAAIANIEKRFGKGSVMTLDQMRASDDERERAHAAQAERRAQVAAARRAEIAELESQGRDLFGRSPESGGRSADDLGGYGVQDMVWIKMRGDYDTVAALHVQGDMMQSALDSAGLSDIGYRQFRNLWADGTYGAPWGPRGIFSAVASMEGLGVIAPPHRLGTETHELFNLLRGLSPEALDALQAAAQEFRRIHDEYVSQNRGSFGSRGYGGSAYDHSTGLFRGHRYHGD
jgi:hypothetical protein